MEALPGESSSSVQLGEEAREAGLTGKLENLGGEVLEDGRGVDGSLGSNTHVVLGADLEVTVDTSDGELRRERGARVSEGSREI